MSSSGVCAVSRRIRPPVSFSTAMWPPFLSASVRSVTSHAYGSSSDAIHARMRGSSTAPRLSEFDMNA